MVYDITNKNLLNNYKVWFDLIKNFNIKNTFLLGNKNDLNEIKKICKEDINNIKIKNNIKMSYLVSAKNDSQNDLQNMLKEMIYMSNINYQEEEDNDKFKLNSVPKIREIGCWEWFCEKISIF